jgi:hypothetical protein
MVKKVLSPPSIALGLNRFRLASLHMLSLVLRAIYLLGLSNRCQQTSDATRPVLRTSLSIGNFAYRVV